MYESLRGELTGKKSQTVTLLTGGVEWILSVTVNTLHQLPPVGEEAKLFTHLQHREDAMILFGFATEKERTLFRELLTVNGVGPKAAIKILSGIPSDRFLQALDSEDVKTLSRIPGLGTKTAQKIILSLRGRLTALDAEGGATNSPGSTGFNEIIDSLAGMGFDKKKAEKAVSHVAADESYQNLPEAEKESEMLRCAIIQLSVNG